MAAWGTEHGVHGMAPFFVRGVVAMLLRLDDQSIGVVDMKTMKINKAVCLSE